MQSDNYPTSLLIFVITRTGTNEKEYTLTKATAKSIERCKFIK